jgi:hypothetical protein
MEGRVSVRGRVPNPRRQLEAGLVIENPTRRTSQSRVDRFMPVFLALVRSKAKGNSHSGVVLMENYFDSPFKGKPLSEQVTNPNIIVGRYSYYSGYYHGHSFDDCARYLGQIAQPGTGWSSVASALSEVVRRS